MRNIRALIRNKKLFIGSLMFLIIVVLAIFSNFIAPHGYNEYNIGKALSGPSKAAWLGIDHMGRDLLSRILYGTRVSLIVAFSVSLCSSFFGIFIGSIAGYYNNKIIDIIISRFLDILFSIPWILLALLIAVILKPGIPTVIIIMTIIYVPQVARVVRSAVLEIKELDFVHAASLYGERSFNVLFRYILPNCTGPIIIQLIFLMSYTILGEAALSYLGYGVRPPTPSWGLLLQNATQYLWTSPHLIIFPGIAIVFGVLSFNFLGDGLRDLLDPKYRRTYIR